MARPTKKAPAQAPAKTPAAKAKTPVLVEPLAPDALKLVINIIDNADIKGRDANTVVVLKLELARVAGVRGGQ